MVCFRYIDRYLYRFNIGIKCNAAFREVNYFTSAGVKWRVMAVKRLPLFHHSADCMFIYFEVSEPILVTLKIEIRLNRC